MEMHLRHVRLHPAPTLNIASFVCLLARNDPDLIDRNHSDRNTPRKTFTTHISGGSSLAIIHTRTRTGISQIESSSISHKPGIRVMRRPKCRQAGAPSQIRNCPTSTAQPRIMFTLHSISNILTVIPPVLDRSSLHILTHTYAYGRTPPEHHRLHLSQSQHATVD